MRGKAKGRKRQRIRAGGKVGCRDGRRGRSPNHWSKDLLIRNITSYPTSFVGVPHKLSSVALASLHQRFVYLNNVEKIQLVLCFPKFCQ